MTEEVKNECIQDVAQEPTPGKISETKTLVLWKHTHTIKLINFKKKDKRI
jgi:hypothetical protein